MAAVYIGVIYLADLHEHTHTHPANIRTGPMENASDLRITFNIMTHEYMLSIVLCVLNTKYLSKSHSLFVVYNDLHTLSINIKANVRRNGIKQHFK